MKQETIYILGYGFSGSTVFERILALSEDIVGLGELWNLKQDLDINEICSCNFPAEKCEFWGTAYYANKEKNKEIVDLVNHSFLKRKERYFVDNSKSPLKRLWHIFRMKKAYAIVWIHLYRNGKEVLHSTLKRKKNSNFPKRIYLTIKTSLHWNIANIIAYLLRTFSRRPSRAYSYTQLIQNPTKVSDELSSFLKTRIQYDHNTLIPTTHQLTGNLSRHKEIILNTNVNRVEKDGALVNALFYFFGFPSSILCR